LAGLVVLIVDATERTGGAIGGKTVSEMRGRIGLNAVT
jgi:hypothetical protein